MPDALDLRLEGLIPLGAFTAKFRIALPGRMTPVT
jgi:hypothetical protein